MAELKTRILVVDDDQRLRDLLVRYLGGEGYEVKAVPDGAGMDKQLARERYDLVVLDLMLPGEDGLSICRRLRAQGGAQPGAPAIIMLTAKGDDVERIVGLEMGADDYLPKPFNPRELLARINAVLRRRAPAGPPGAPAASTEAFQFGEFSLNLSTRTLTRGGKTVPLTTGEVSVLKVLVHHPRRAGERGSVPPPPGPNRSERQRRAARLSVDQQREARAAARQPPAPARHATRALGARQGHALRQ